MGTPLTSMGTDLHELRFGGEIGFESRSNAADNCGEPNENRTQQREVQPSSSKLFVHKTTKTTTKFASHQHEHRTDPNNPATPTHVTMHRGGTGQQGIEGTPAGPSASANQLMTLMNELRAEMASLLLGHAEELEEIRHQHETLVTKVAQDTSQVPNKPPVAFDTIKAPKHLIGTILASNDQKKKKMSVQMTTSKQPWVSGLLRYDVAQKCVLINGKPAWPMV